MRCPLKKFILTLFLFIGTQGNALAEPFVSPQVCQQLAMEIISIAEVRDAGDPLAKTMDALKAAVPDESEMAYQFYSFWIKSVYASKMSPEDLGVAFYTSCIMEQGDLGKLYGLEV